MIFTNHNVFGIGHSNVGARSLGLGHANLTLTDLWASNNNQAGLAKVKEFGLGFAYENRFGLSELSLKNLNLALPVKWGTFGLTVQQFGFTDYNENKFGLAYGLNISKNVSLGVQLDYLLISVAEAQTQNRNGFTAEIGLLANVTDKLKFGAHIYNFPNSSLSGEFEEKIPMIIRLGLNYEFSPKLFAVVDIEKNIDLDPNLKVGIEYHPIDALFFRGGLNTYDFHFNGGLGVELKNFNLDLGFSHQTYIGYVSQISLHYTLHKK
jgi:opacity protein-like surface antigen